MKNLSLQKYLQAAGFDSRRNIRKMISQGKIKINGQVVVDPNTMVEMGRDAIRYENKRLDLKIEKKGINKPRILNSI